MTPFQRRRNPYVNRMIQDMQIRNFAASTIDSYTWHVDKFCQHFGKMPEELGLEEIRQYQLYLVNQKKASWSSFNQAVCGLRFLYEVTLGKPWAIQHIPFGKRPKKLPVVLSDQEASRLIECTENPKHRAVVLKCYAAGLRLAKATHLKINDNDGKWDWDYFCGTKHFLEYIEFLYYLKKYDYRDYMTSDTSPTRWDIIGTFEANSRISNKIWRLLEQIDTTCREVLHLYYFQNFSMDSIANHLSYKNAAVAKKKKYSCPKCKGKQVKQLISSFQTITSSKS